MNTTIEFVHERYVTIVAMCAADAKLFMGRADNPRDFGAADPKRYRAGARIYAFRGSANCTCRGCETP